MISKHCDIIVCVMSTLRGANDWSNWNLAWIRANIWVDWVYWLMQQRNPVDSFQSTKEFVIKFAHIQTLGLNRIKRSFLSVTEREQNLCVNSSMRLRCIAHSNVQYLSNHCYSVRMQCADFYRLVNTIFSWLPVGFILSLMRQCYRVNHSWQIQQPQHIKRLFILLLQLTLWKLMDLPIFLIIAPHCPLVKTFRSPRFVWHFFSHRNPQRRIENDRRSRLGAENSSREEELEANEHFARNLRNPSRHQCGSSAGGPGGRGLRGGSRKEGVKQANEPSAKIQPRSADDLPGDDLRQRGGQMR